MSSGADGRRAVRLALVDSIILIFGTLGLAISLPSLVAIAAIAHLVVSFAAAPSKGAWLAAQPVAIAVAFLIVAGSAIAVLASRYGGPLSDSIETILYGWPSLLATAIVAGGIMMKLVALPGTLDQVREFQEAGSTTGRQQAR